MEVGSSSLSEAFSKEGSTEVPVEKTEEGWRCDETEENSEAEPNVMRHRGAVMMKHTERLMLWIQTVRMQRRRVKTTD